MECVIDTNILIDDPECIFRFQNPIIHMAVLEELDALKTDSRVGFKARKAIRLIEENYNSIEVDIVDYLLLMEIGFEDKFDEEEEEFNEDELYENDQFIPPYILRTVDNMLIACASFRGAHLVSNDRIVLIKAKVFSVDAISYKIETFNDVYKGYREIVLEDNDIAKLYSEEFNTEALENEFIVVKDGEGKVIDKFVKNGGKFTKIDLKPIKSKFLGTIKPRNLQQELLFNLLQNENIKIKVCTGKFGTGKDFIMIAHAIDLIEKKKFEKLVWVRNTVEVKNSNPVGFLKGGLDDKLKPYAMPLADHLGGVDGLDALIEKGVIELQHLGFIRGRDLKNCIIYCSEAENMTKEHVQLLIGRLGENSILLINGDYKQVDDSVFKDNNGLNRIIDKLAGNRLFGYVELNKTERSEASSLADLLD